MFFFDEWSFTTDIKVNRKNYRWFSHSPDHVLIIGKSSSSTNVHSSLTLSAVFNKGDVLSPYFFEIKRTLNKIHLHSHKLLCDRD